MTDTYKQPPAASWRFLLAFLVALGLVPGIPGFEHVRDALLYSSGLSATERRADPNSWPVNPDLVPAAAAPQAARILGNASGLRKVHVGSYAAIIRDFSDSSRASVLLRGMTRATAGFVLQVLGLGVQRTLRGPPR